MGKLHKIRHKYNKLTSKEKGELAQCIRNYMPFALFSENVTKLYNRPYRYYLLHLLIKDGVVERPRVVKPVSLTGTWHKVRKAAS